MRRLFLFLLLAAICFQHTKPCSAQNSSKPANQAGSLAGAKLFSRAADLQNKEQWDRAISTWRIFLRKYARDPLARQAHNYLGVCLLQKESFQSAATEFEKVLANGKQDELSEEAHLNLAYCYYSQGFKNDPGRLKKATQIFHSHIERYPQSSMHDQALFYLAETLMILEQPDRAIEAYQQLVADCPKSNLRADALWALGKALEDLKNTESAESTFQQLASEYPEHTMAGEARLRHAESLIESEQWHDAAVRLAELAKAESEEKDYISLRLGLCLEKLERFDSASEIYSALVNEYPTSEFADDATLGAARSYALAHNTTDAESWLERVDTENPDKAMEVAHWRCRILLWNGDHDTAAKVAAKALADHPGGAFRTEVALGEAEALARNPENLKVAADKYLELAKSIPDGELQWRALMGAADSLIQLERADAARSVATLFLEKHEGHEHGPAFEFIVAESHRIDGDDSQARDTLERLARDHQEHPLSRVWKRRLAGIQLRQRDFEHALSALDSLDKSEGNELNNEEKSEIAFMRATALEGLGRDDDAVLAYREAHQHLPEGEFGSKALLGIAAIENRRGNGEAAETAVDEARKLTLEPNAEQRARLELAEAALNAGDHMKATEIFASLTAGENVSEALVPHALFGEAYGKLYQREYDESRKLFCRFLAQYPDHPLSQHARYGRAMVSGYSSQYSAAIEDLDEVLQHDPPVAYANDARYIKALYHKQLKNHAIAVRTFEEFLKDAPNNRRREYAMFQLALCEAEQGNVERSLTWTQQMLAVSSESEYAAEALAAAGKVCYRHARFADAERIYEQVLTHQATDKLSQAARYQLGWSQFRQEKWQAALDTFESIAGLPLTPMRETDILHLQADCLFELGQHAEAAEFYEQVQGSEEVKPEMRHAALFRGAFCHQLTENWSDARQLLEQLLVLAPSEPMRTQAQLRLARAYEKEEDNELALREYESISDSSLVEFAAEARVRRGRLLFQLGKPLKSMREFQKVMYGFDEETNQRTREWVAMSFVEAGNCSAHLAKLASDREEAAEHIKRAEEYYRTTMKEFGNLRAATLAAKSIEAL